MRLLQHLERVLPDPVPELRWFLMTATAEAIVLYSIPIAAKVLDCSKDTVYRLIASGELRAVDIAPPGSRQPKTRVRSDDADAFIERRTRKAP